MHPFWINRPSPDSPAARGQDFVKAWAAQRQLEMDNRPPNLEPKPSCSELRVPAAVLQQLHLPEATAQDLAAVSTWSLVKGTCCSSASLSVRWTLCPDHARRKREKNTGICQLGDFNKRHQGSEVRVSPWQPKSDKELNESKVRIQNAETTSPASAQNTLQSQMLEAQHVRSWNASN